MTPADKRRGLLLASLGAIAFAGKAIIIKYAYLHYAVDAVTLLMFRMLFSMPLFLALAHWAGRGRPPLTGPDLRTVAGLGFSGYYLSSFLDFAGLHYVSASLERLILYLNPTLVLGIGYLVFKRRITRGQLLALGVSYAGVVCVFAHEFTVTGSNVPLGAALVFGSAVSYAIYLTYSGEAVRRLGALRLSGLATSVACVICIAQFLLMRPVSAACVPAPVLWLSVMNATLCTFVPVLLVMLALERIGPALTAQTGSIGPLATILLAVVFLGEHLTAWIVAGTALVLLGVWMLARERSDALQRPLM